ncbi:hypothetical protein B0J13DRAFT_557071 [Dactylonectria estremocensis]|uniref:Uncharacterized protein n=1 Tax=Dactylonectria estremocensis TaxID=1079267 RepID=A0A9P9EQI8_9HYPO|nr:hypothetical protein B0J13DRAFT_557071 [Dactylonectria estremocensis]
MFQFSSLYSAMSLILGPFTISTSPLPEVLPSGSNILTVWLEASQYLSPAPYMNENTQPTKSSIDTKSTPPWIPGVAATRMNWLKTDSASLISYKGRHSDIYPVSRLLAVDLARLMLRNGLSGQGLASQHSLRLAFRPTW